MQSAIHLFSTAGQRPPAGLCKPALVWILTLSLLLVQSLGMLHRVLHASGAGSNTLAVAGAKQLAHSRDNAGTAGVLGKMFSSHASDTDCRLYDQASHGGAAPHVASLALPVVLPSLAVAIFKGEALARRAALFDARGPPLTC